MEDIENIELESNPLSLRYQDVIMGDYYDEPDMIENFDDAEIDLYTGEAIKDIEFETGLSKDEQLSQYDPQTLRLIADSDNLMEEIIQNRPDSDGNINNINCIACYDCTDCRFCTNCTDCRGCELLVDSHNCDDCINCEDNCRNCDDCHDSQAIVECSGCYDCSGCIDCKECKNTTNTISSDNLLHCDDCNFSRNSEYCYNADYLEDCEECDDCSFLISCKKCTETVFCYGCRNCKNCDYLTFGVGIENYSLEPLYQLLKDKISRKEHNDLLRYYMYYSGKSLKDLDKMYENIKKNRKNANKYATLNFGSKTKDNYLTLKKEGNLPNLYFDDVFHNSPFLVAFSAYVTNPKMVLYLKRKYKLDNKYFPTNIIRRIGEAEVVKAVELTKYKPEDPRRSPRLKLKRELKREEKLRNLSKSEKLVKRWGLREGRDNFGRDKFVRKGVKPGSLRDFGKGLV